MGRTRSKKKTVAKTVLDGPAASLPTAAPSIPALLQKAQALIVQCDYDLALRFTTRILQQQPSNAEAREMLGVIQLEMGEIDAARAVSLHSTRLRCPFI
jgi:Flp pilus assembly protein TadD